jgi:uncharacterized protein VirK/YbjX
MGRLEVLRRLHQAAGYARPGTAAIGLRRTASHFLRCTPYLETFRDWFGNPANPALREALVLRPSLVTCVVHPYLNAGWSARRKLAVISTHYDLLRGPLGFLRFAPPVTIGLADVGGGVCIRLDKPGGYEHEGELVVNLFEGDVRLYSIVFTLGRSGAQRIAYVGGLQGLHSPAALEIYRTLTHRMHGLRPRDLLVSAFRSLCCALGVDTILAVTDARRVSTNAYFTSSTQVYTSYDSAWAENGGGAAHEGFIELSPHREHRAAEDIPPRKRAQYRRRYAMIDALAQQIGQKVQDLGRPDATSLANDIDDA